MRLSAICGVLAVAALAAWLRGTPAQPTPPSQPPIVKAIHAISPSQLEGNLSFLASDTLQGRYTPSPGLQVAAEFIASRFRAAGLQPGGDDDFFQTAHMVERTVPALASGLSVQTAGQTFTIKADALAIRHMGAPKKIERASLVRMARMDPALLSGADLTRKAVLVVQPDFRSMTPEKAQEAYAAMQKFQQIVRQSKADLELVVTKELGSSTSQLVPANAAREDTVPRIAVVESAAEKLLSADTTATVSVDIPAAREDPVTVHNVVGILPGSDPSLKNSYVLVTAHYDHIGTRDTGRRLSNPQSSPNPNDNIYNGANDDGSGTVSVIEIARALAISHVRPRRTLVFMTFFGEERGELGSAYYIAHPLFPISATVADFNLEQVGRTDELDNGKTVKRVNSLSITGFDYSDVTGYLVRAGKQLGVTVYKDGQASDQYFQASDNAAFAEAGVPAHSITVAFDFADYHGVGDEWRKIDYQNMARVDRVIALAAFGVANAAKAPEWSPTNPKTAAFRTARKMDSFHRE